MLHTSVVSKGARGLISMEDCIILEELSPVDYLRQRKERLLKSAWRRRNRSEVEHPNDFKRRKHEKTARDCTGHRKSSMGNTYSV